MKLLVIKLGGSVITFKDSNLPKVRAHILKRLASEIASLYPKYNLILIHGAGSFGHPIAKKYRLTEGIINKDSVLGFAKTALATTQLNSLVIKHLVTTKIPAVTLKPNDFITQTGGKLNPFDTKFIKKMLNQGLVPVLYGDVVLDTELGCSIVSGDAIAPYLTKDLKADKLIFLSDVDGIFETDPKINPQAECIPKVTNKNLNAVLNSIHQNNHNDVTGEMRGKISALKKSAKGLSIIVTSGLIPGNLLAAVGPNPPGTLLHFG